MSSTAETEVSSLYFMVTVHWVIFVPEISLYTIPRSRTPTVSFVRLTSMPRFIDVVKYVFWAVKKRVQGVYAAIKGLPILHCAQFQIFPRVVSGFRIQNDFLDRSGAGSQVIVSASVIKVEPAYQVRESEDQSADFHIGYT